MAGFKIDRIEQDVKKELCGMFLELKDPRISHLLSIIKIDLSKDLSVCKVFVSAIEGYDKTVESVKGLTAASGYIRREIAHRIEMRRCPEFKFIADDSISYSAKINDILKDL